MAQPTSPISTTPNFQFKLPKNLIEIIGFENHGAIILTLLKFSYTNPFGFYNVNNTVCSYSILALESKAEYIDNLALGVIDEDKLPNFTNDWLILQNQINSNIYPKASIALCTPRKTLVIDTLEEILKQELKNQDLLNYEVINFDIHKILSQDVQNNKNLKETGQKRFLNNYLLTMSYKFVKPPYNHNEAEKLMSAHSIDVMHRKLKIKGKTRYNADYVNKLYPMSYKDVKQLSIFSATKNAINPNTLEQYKTQGLAYPGVEKMIEIFKDYVTRWYGAVQSSEQFINYEKESFAKIIPALPSTTMEIKKSHKI